MFSCYYVFAMKTWNLEANNSNAANDKYSSFNWHQLTYILAFSYSSRGISHELTPSKVVYQSHLSTSSESTNRTTDLNVLRLFHCAVSTAYSSCSGFTTTSGCMAYHQKVMDGRCVQRIEDSLMYHIQKTSPYGRKAFSFVSPSAWNSLPNYLKNSSFTHVMFKRSLKTFCFSK